MVSTLCDIHNISKLELFTFVMSNKNLEMLLLLEEIIILSNGKKNVHEFSAFKFETSKLRGGEEYVLKYMLRGKILATRKIRFEEGTYDFSRFRGKIL